MQQTNFLKTTESKQTDIQKILLESQLLFRQAQGIYEVR